MTKRGIRDSSPEGIRLISIGKVREYGEGCDIIITIADPTAESLVLAGILN